MKTTMAVLTAITMIGLAMAPLGSADRYQDADCTAAAPPSNPTCKTAFGPAGATDKVFGGVGAGFCFGPGTGLPFPCNIAGGGAVFFDVSGGPDSDQNWVGSGLGVIQAHVWAKWIGGALTLPDSSLEGFEITVCSDRDDSTVCTNAANPVSGVVVDDFETANSSCRAVPLPDLGLPDPLPAPGSPDCFNDTGAPVDCTGNPKWDGHENGAGPNKTKDSKDPCDPTDAEVTICIYPDEEAAGGAYDDVVVFISAYTDVSGLGEGSNGYMQAHASSGNFEVWLTEEGTGNCPFPRP